MSQQQPLLQYRLFNSRSDVFAFSTTRLGGISQGNYASLNCTPYTGDDPACVERNQELLRSYLPAGIEELVIPYQTHGTRILSVNESYGQAAGNDRFGILQGIDALVSQIPGYCLCVSTADCIPVLVYDQAHRAVAAIHAGWRGTVNGITRRTLDTMRQLYGTKGEEVIACIGPGISLEAFEVGDEVYEAFRSAGFPMDYIATWKPETHKWHLDLWAANRLQLHEFGIPPQSVESACICTYNHHEEFFSARRLGVHSGRILSGIVIKR